MTLSNLWRQNDPRVGLIFGLIVGVAATLAAPKTGTTQDRPVAAPSAHEPIQEAKITDSDREHWSFRPLASPQIPVLEDPSWCRTPVDRFVLARIRENGLEPYPEADRGTLIRRLTFNLTGLPPTPSELA